MTTDRPARPCSTAWTPSSGRNFHEAVPFDFWASVQCHVVRLPQIVWIKRLHEAVQETRRQMRNPRRGYWINREMKLMLEGESMASCNQAHMVVTANLATMTTSVLLEKEHTSALLRGDYLASKKGRKRPDCLARPRFMSRLPRSSDLDQTNCRAMRLHL